VNLDDAVVFTEFSLLLRGDVLVSEEDDSSFSNEESELVLLLVGQLRELDPNEPEAGRGSQKEGGFKAEQGFSTYSVPRWALRWMTSVAALNKAFFSGSACFPRS
jgi:hypothetical protein